MLTGCLRFMSLSLTASFMSLSLTAYESMDPGGGEAEARVVLTFPGDL